MGKQFNKPPENLEEVHGFLQNQIGNQLDNYNLKFDSDEAFFDGMLSEVQEMHQSSSIYVDDEIYNNYLKTFNKSQREDSYLQQLYLDSTALIIGDAKYPSFMVKNSNFNLPTNSKWSETLNNNNSLNEALKSVGRIEYINKNDRTKGWIGTGWLYVNKEYIITNTHVADEFSQDGENFGEFKFIENISSYIDFIEEYENRQELTFKIDEVCYKADLAKGDLDIAILRISSLSGANLPEGLEFDNDLIDLVNEVVIVGYPDGSRDKRPYTSAYNRWQSSIFCDAQICSSKYLGVKRVSPGEIIKSEGEFLLHNCSTLLGNSGSPLINPSTGKVVAVHFEGDPNGYNYNKAIKAKYIYNIMLNKNLI